MIRFARLHFEIVFFFILLFLLVWLGDGKQEIVDVVGAGGFLWFAR
jgi:hypothetical protein